MNKNLDSKDTMVGTYKSITPRLIIISRGENQLSETVVFQACGCFNFAAPASRSLFIAYFLFLVTAMLDTIKKFVPKNVWDRVGNLLAGIIGLIVMVFPRFGLL